MALSSVKARLVSSLGTTVPTLRLTRA
jgi:hypothetical protein